MMAVTMFYQTCGCRDYMYYLEQKLVFLFCLHHNYNSLEKLFKRICLFKDMYAVDAVYNVIDV